MLLEVADKLNAERISGKEALDVDKKMHCFTETLLKSQTVMIRCGWGIRGMGNTVHAVVCVGMNGRYGGVSDIC